MEKEIYLAGGCFWGTEKYLLQIQGVLSTEVGYANGRTEAPSYEEVCGGQTGHAETVKVRYDDDRVSLRNLLRLFYQVIDPTSVNRQGYDVGVQYRTGVYYTSREELAAIEASLSDLQKKYDKPLAVECLPLNNYSPAEEYHQKYLDKNPNGYCHISPQRFEAARYGLKAEAEEEQGTAHI